MRPIFVFCEGAHDIAFFSRLFKANGAKPYEKSLSQYEPTIVGRLIIKQYEGRVVENGHFRYGGKNQGVFVPENPPILQSAWRIDDNDNLYLFFGCHGGDNRDAVSAFIQGIAQLAAPGAPEISLNGFGIVFTGDADDAGAAKRQSDWITAFSECLKDILLGFEKLEVNKVERIIRSGAYSATGIVFSSPDRTTGTLEDLLWPHLESGYGTILNEGSDFIKKHGIPGTKVASATSKARKAAITVAGQIESPSFSLSVILRDTKVLDGDTLRNDLTCTQFWQLLASI